jgi:hypothetical protein
MFLIKAYNIAFSNDDRQQRPTDHLLFALVALPSLVYFFLNTRVFLDDVFIYLRVARNIADGIGPLLNAGDSHFAVTSPLWVYILAFFVKLGIFGDAIQTAHILSTLLLGLAVTFAYLALRPVMGRWAVLTPPTILFTFLTLSTLGSEIPLVYAALFGLLWAFHIRSHYLLSGIFAAIAYLGRAETVLILPILCLFDAWLHHRKREPFGLFLGKWLRLALGFAPLVFCWHAFYAWHFHTLFPNTLQTKIVQGRSGQWPLYSSFSRYYVLDILRGMKWLAIPLIAGLLYGRRIALSLLAFTTVHYYAYTYMAIPHYHWYFYDFFLVVPLFTLFGALAILRGGWRLAVHYHPGFFSSYPVKAFGTLIMLGVAGLLITTTSSFQMLKPFLNEPRLEIYTRIAESVKPLVKPGDTLLAPEIGILGYQLNTVILRDINGIASPGVSLRTINKVDHFVERYNPRFLFFNRSVLGDLGPMRSFKDHQGNRIRYRRIYPQGELKAPADSMFMRVTET